MPRKSIPVPRGTRRNRRKESGYTLLLVIFMVATMLILGAVATQSVLTEGRREREADMIWRGEQYERAIGLYYRKLGHYPTKIEDLTNATNGVRYLRQAYTDPTNKSDGSWRFIYIGPNGQLTGSNLYQTITQYQLAVQGASPSTTPANVNGSQTSSTSTGIFGILSGASGGPGAASAVPAASGMPTTPTAATSTSPIGTPEAQPQGLGGPVIGGSIVGVGSSTKQASIMVYQGAKTYDDWEFLWAPPTAGAGVAATPGGIPGQSQPGQAVPGQTQPGQSTPGGIPGAPSSASPQPGMPAMPGLANPGSVTPNENPEQPQ